MHVLVNMGELIALDAKYDGQPWQVSLREAGMDISLTNSSLATSAGEALTFGEKRHVSHMIDPNSGRSPNQFRSLSVAHKSETVADALSTGLYAAKPQAMKRIIARIPGLRVWAFETAKSMRTFGV